MYFGNSNGIISGFPFACQWHFDRCYGRQGWELLTLETCSPIMWVGGNDNRADMPLLMALCPTQTSWLSVFVSMLLWLRFRFGSEFAGPRSSEKLFQIASRLWAWVQNWIGDWDRGGGQNVPNARGGGELAPKVVPWRLGLLTPKLTIFYRISVERGQFQGPLEIRNFYPPL